ncbi:hypothetical protein BKA70DRAFT_723385 [Coprinopsis sp. MPI-PUGE-AT-0042]|nr:hypothetical protein BKA70DRAFT_723385 [Coprinopsis sp. MPI-PUGE-AT-0042]
MNVNDLPDELLREIFMWGVFGSERYQIAPKKRTFRYGYVDCLNGGPNWLHPILIGHICSRWRHLSLSTSHLWSSIALTAPRAKDLELFALWLERSGNASLSIKLSAGSWHSEDTIGVFPKAMQLAFQHHHRWKEIILQVPRLGADTIADLARTWQGIKFGRLEHFSMFGDPSLQRSVHREWNPFPTVYTSPVLKSLDLTCYDPMLWIQGAPLQQLTALSVRYALTLPDVLKLLSECKMLEVLKFQADGKAWDDEKQLLQAPPLVHRSLKSLSISHGRYLPQLMSRLITPQLEELRLNGNLCPTPSGATSQTSLNHITILVEQAQWQLKSLTLQYITKVAEESMLQLLAQPSLSGLEELILNVSTITDATITAFTLTPGSQLLPKMRRLSFGYCTSSRDLVSHMIQSRSATLHLRGQEVSDPRGVRSSDLPPVPPPPNPK